MGTTAEDVMAALREMAPDPGLSARRLASRLRLVGVRAGNEALFGAIRSYRAAARARPDWHRRNDDAVRKDAAAHLLGLSVQRIDQLRRDGTLRSWHDPTTNVVHVSTVDVLTEMWRRVCESVRAHVAP